MKTTCQIKGIDPDFWAAVKAKAAADNVSVKQVILALLKGYVENQVGIAGVSLAPRR